MLMGFSFSRGMTVTSGVVTIKKDDSNLIGISIGGGAPLCPCLYVVQVIRMPQYYGKPEWKQEMKLIFQISVT